MLYLTVLLISMIITIALMPGSRAIACRLQAIDVPNARKVHSGVIPKCGGIAMAIGSMAPILLWAPITPLTKAVLIGSIILVIFGVMDDIRDLGFKTKFTGQFCAALVAILVGGVKISSLGSLLPEGVILPDWIAIPLTLVVIVGVTNATNLSDGLDGLAGGISLLIFICIGYLGYCERDIVVTLISIAVGGSILGFLRFNSYPAELFMGDAGSQYLGFVAIVLSLDLTQNSNNLCVILPLIIIGLPILDTITVMIKRLVKGKQPFVADKRHFHHVLMLMGLYHSEAVLFIYGIQALLIMLAIALRLTNEWMLLAIYAVFSFVILGFLQQVENRQLRITRQRLLNPIKTRLRTLKESGFIIRFSFRVVTISIPLLLFFYSLIPAPRTASYYLLTVIALILVLLTWWFKRDRVDSVLKLAMYVITPFLVYTGDSGLYALGDKNFAKFFNLYFVILFVFVLLTLNFTRRTTRFKSTPLDFLVVFIVILISNLPNSALSYFHLGLVAAKTGVFFFSYEVIIGEVRLKSPKLTATTITLLCVVSLKFIIILASDVFIP